MELYHSTSYSMLLECFAPTPLHNRQAIQIGHACAVICYYHGNIDEDKAHLYEKAEWLHTLLYLWCR